MSASIFLSYRWDDSGGWTRTLYDRIAAVYGRDAVFFDTESMTPGVDIDEAIERNMATSRVVLPVMGRRWLETLWDRVEGPDDDRVEWEIRTALAQDKRILPVLVDGGGMPRSSELPDHLRALQSRVGVEISPSWVERDVATLLELLREDLSPGDARRRVRRSAPSGGPVPTGGSRVTRTATPQVETDSRIGDDESPEVVARVGKSPEATHAVLADALDDGASKVLLEPGIHGEAVVIDRSVELAAVEAGTASCVAPPGHSAVEVRNGSVRMVGLQLQTDGHGPEVIRCVGGSITLNGCQISSSGGGALAAGGDAGLALDESVLLGPGVGIRLRDQATCRVAATRIAGSRHGVDAGDHTSTVLRSTQIVRPSDAGISAAGAAELDIEDCRLVHGRRGIALQDSAVATIASLLIESPTDHCIEAGATTRVRLSRSSLRGARRTVLLRDSAEAVLVDCDLAESTERAIDVGDDARVEVIGTTLHQLGEAAALVVGDDRPGQRNGEQRAEALFRDCTVRSTSAPFALYALAGSDMTLLGGHIADVVGGLAVYPEGRASVAAADRPHIEATGDPIHVFEGASLAVTDPEQRTWPGLAGGGSVHYV